MRSIMHKDGSSSKGVDVLYFKNNAGLVVSYKYEILLVLIITTR